MTSLNTTDTSDRSPAILKKAGDFAAEITLFKLNRGNLGTRAATLREHLADCEAVANTLYDRGITPDTLRSC